LKQVNVTAFTADVSITATSVGTANQVVSSGAITYEAVPHLIEFYATRIDVGTQASFLILRDGTTVLGTIMWYPANAILTPVYGAHYLTPTTASHTYNVAGWNSSASTTTVQSGTGGTAGDSSTSLGGFIRITRIPT